MLNLDNKSFKFFNFLILINFFNWLTLTVQVLPVTPAEQQPF